MVVGLFPSGNSPYLLDWIQIRRIWGERDEGHPVTDILIFGFFFDKSFRFLVPGGVIQDEDDSLVGIIGLALGDELPEALDSGFPIEPQRLCDKKPSVRRNDKSTVGCVLPSCIRFQLGLAALRRPFPGNCALYAEVNLVLVNDDILLV